MIAWDGERRAWRVTGYDAAVQVLRDPDTFTVDDPRFSTARVVGPSMLSLDGAEHARHRDPFAPAFRRSQVNTRFAPFVTAEASRLLDELGLAGGGDLRARLANPLATAVIAEALGLDGTDSGVVAELSACYLAIVASVSAISSGGSPSRDGNTAFAALRTVLFDHLHDAESQSLLTAAVAELADDEVVSNAAVMMFGAIETTEGMILNLAWHLLADAAQLDMVIEDRALLGAAVEESLRLEPAAAVVDRYATKTVTLAGSEVAAGDMVVVSLRDANRDSAMFPEPDRFDPRRPNAHRHLAFAVGPHVCIGMDLARLETSTAIGQLIDRFPTVRLDPRRPQSGPGGDVFRKPSELSVVLE